MFRTDLLSITRSLDTVFIANGICHTEILKWVKLLVCVCVFVCMYVCVCVCMYVYICVYVCMYMCVFMYVYICVYVCMCVCTLSLICKTCVVSKILFYIESFKIVNYFIKCNRFCR